MAGYRNGNYGAALVAQIQILCINGMLCRGCGARYVRVAPGVPRHFQCTQCPTVVIPGDSWAVVHGTC